MLYYFLVDETTADADCCEHQAKIEELTRENCVLKEDLVVLNNEMSHLKKKYRLLQAEISISRFGNNQAGT